MVIIEKELREAQAKHKDWDKIWHDLNDMDNLGNCSFLYKKYGCPDEYQDFYDAYVSDTEVGRIDCGRSQECLDEIAIRLKELTDGSVKDCINYILKKVILDTVDGGKWERKFNITMAEYGLDVEEPTYYEDSRYGIDKKVYLDDRLLCFIQIKPKTFFMGNSNEWLKIERRNAITKINRCSSRYQVPTYFVLYDKASGNFVKHPMSQKITWKPEQLLDNDGNSQYNIK